MEKIKSSLCITLKNEISNIEVFWQSVLNQTKMPNEVVFVDGGSTDGTWELLKKLTNESKIKVCLIKLVGLNRSEGRNCAILNSKFKVIAITDAGCILDKKWLANITRPFNDKTVDVVPGAYEIDKNGLTNFALVAAELTNQQPTNDGNRYLSSSRSFALRKKVWKKSGGYPNKLNTAEDLVFTNKLYESGFKHLISPKAIVYWRPPNSILKILVAFYNYSLGDGLAGLESPHAFKYGVKLFIIGNLLFFSIFLDNFWMISTIILITWWIFQTWKIRSTNFSLKNISVFTVLIAIVSLFWVTLIGFIIGLGKSGWNVRK